MPLGIILGVGGIASSIFGASQQADASQAAADEQYKAAQLAAHTQLHMYNQTRRDLSPYLSTGTSALSQLADLFGLNSGGFSAASDKKLESALQNYPGYQFQFNQGLQGLDRSAASRGLLLSGAQLKDSQAYGQGMAQSALQSYLANLTGLSNLGENAGAQVGNAGTAAGQGIASSQLAGGQALAAGTVGGANAWTSGIQGALNSALTGYSIYNQDNLSPLNLDSNLGSPLSVLPTNTLSDARAKTEIERVGKTDDGLPIYLYRYKAGGPKHMGVMAQDVERVRPDAVGMLPSGLKTVNYGKLSPLSDFRMAA